MSVSCSAAWRVGLLVLFWRAVSGELPLSSHQCGGEPSFCIFQNLVLWQGQLHYVSNDASLLLPPVALHLGQEPPQEQLHYRPELSSPEALQRALEQGGSQAGELQELPGGAEDVVLYSVQYGRSWGLQLGEYLPTLHNAACKHLGRCSYDSRHGLRLLDMSPAPAQGDGSASSSSGSNKWSAFHCFSDQPKVNIRDPSLAGKAYLLTRVLAGVGPECRGSSACSGASSARASIPTEQLQSYRQRLAECLGFDAQQSAPLDPMRIVVVDRYYGSGGHILNVGQVVEALRERYKGTADVDLQYMEDLNARTQAKLWSSASVLIHVYSGAQGAWFFLPQGAVVVQVPTHPGLRAREGEAAQQLALDLGPVSQVTWVPANLTDPVNVHLKSELVWADPEWQALTSQLKVGVMENGCRVLEDNRPLFMRCTLRWVRKYSSLVLPLDVLLPAVDLAVSELYSKLGRAVPAGLGSLGESSHNRGSSSGSGSSSSSGSRVGQLEEEEPEDGEGSAEDERRRRRRLAGLRWRLL